MLYRSYEVLYGTRYYWLAIVVAQHDQPPRHISYCSNFSSGEFDLPTAHGRCIDLVRGAVTVRSIRQIENALKGKPGIEIELHNTERFHIGDLDWSLQIGDLKLARPTRRSADHHSLTYVLDLDDWNNLKDGAPLYLTWGYYDAKKKEVKPFAYLNKKILGKTRQSNGIGDSGLTNRFRPIAKSAG